LTTRTFALEMNCNPNPNANPNLGDTDMSVRIELNVYDMAAVVLKNPLRPTVARGLRGTAGSGKGSL
jgi:hypothetical protein